MGFAVLFSWSEVIFFSTNWILCAKGGLVFSFSRLAVIRRGLGVAIPMALAVEATANSWCFLWLETGSCSRDLDFREVSKFSNISCLLLLCVRGGRENCVSSRKCRPCSVDLKLRTTSSSKISPSWFSGVQVSYATHFFVSTSCCLPKQKQEVKNFSRSYGAR